MIRTYLPYLMSAVTIIQLYLAGRKDARNWLLGLGNQTLWLTWIVTTEAWGLLPMTGALLIIYTRNYRLWTRPAAQAVAKSDSSIDTLRTPPAKSAPLAG